MMLKRYWLSLLALTIFMAPPACAADDGDVLASKVLAIFKEKCFSCHSPEAKNDAKTRKAMKKMDCIQDLVKVRANPKWVVPNRPDDSEIYKEVHKDDMPPDDSDIAPLSDAQKDVVKQWILAGAPAGKTAVAATTTTSPTISATTDSPKRAPRSLISRLIEFIGRFHPLAAHTPIAVLMAAAIAEALYLRHPAPALTGASRFCAILGAMGAVATASLGWAMAEHTPGSQELELHRWLGTIVASVSVPIALLGEWGARRAHREGRKWHGFSRWAFRLSIFGLAAFVGYTAHVGGLLVWPGLFDFPK